MPYSEIHEIPVSYNNLNVYQKNISICQFPTAISAYIEHNL